MLTEEKKKTAHLLNSKRIMIDPVIPVAQSKIGEYKFIKSLGKGTFGSVYLGNKLPFIS